MGINRQEEWEGAGGTKKETGAGLNPEDEKDEDLFRICKETSSQGIVCPNQPPWSVKEGNQGSIPVSNLVQ